LLDANSHFEKAGSSMYTGALDDRPAASLATIRVAVARTPVMGRTARDGRDLRPF
jgi:hypothetical protein